MGPFALVELLSELGPLMVGRIAGQCVPGGVPVMRVFSHEADVKVSLLHSALSGERKWVMGRACPEKPAASSGAQQEASDRRSARAHRSAP